MRIFTLISGIVGPAPRTAVLRTALLIVVLAAFIGTPRAAANGRRLFLALDHVK